MIGVPLRRLDVCDSTSDVAAAWARDPLDPAPHGAAVVAAQQRAGRGRLGRVWHSPPAGNLYLSIVLRPPLEPHRVPPLTLCAGLAVADAVNAAGADASIKWPNDVLVGGRKIAGVLTEMSTRAGKLDHVVVGVGVNVNVVEFPAELAATSLALATGRDHDLDELRDSLCAALSLWFDRYLAGGTAALAPGFAARSALADRPVRAMIEGVAVEGRAIGIDDAGALLLDDGAGRRHRVIAGEIAILEESPHA